MTAARSTGKAAAPASPPAAAPLVTPSLLTRPLGLEGWAELEPVVLASLASREPMLLVGRHGAAKSFLLERLAEALSLSFRCYNASLIDYDDLVGIPLPDESGTGLRYLSTPTAIWGAEVVFIDEISRTRPDLANKLFPIIHERRVQGIDLECLRHRWAAMNPPTPDGDVDPDDEGYLGVEPLDPALADRFTFLIEVPDWEDLSDQEQTRLLVDQFQGAHPLSVSLPSLVAQAEQLFAQLSAAVPQRLAAYVLALGRARHGSKLTPFSTRRMAALLRSALAIHAARTTLSRRAFPDSVPAEIDWEGSLWLALQHGDPSLATGGRVDRAQQLSIHRRAWKLSGLSEGDPWLELLALAEPLDRVLHALTLRDRLTAEELGPLVLDALADQENDALRTAVALGLYLGTQRIHGLPAIVVETLAREVRRVLRPVERTVEVPGRGITPARLVGQLLAGLPDPPERPADRYAHNLLHALLPDGYAGTTPEAVLRCFQGLWARLGLDDLADDGGPQA